MPVRNASGSVVRFGEERHRRDVEEKGEAGQQLLGLELSQRTRSHNTLLAFCVHFALWLTFAPHKRAVMLQAAYREDEKSLTPSASLTGLRY